MDNKKTYQSLNWTKLTGIVSEVWTEEIRCELLAHINLVTSMTFLKLNGKMETLNTTHHILAWQMHLKGNILDIKKGQILSISGHYETQSLQGPRGWKSVLCVFARTFEIVAQEGTLLTEESLPVSMYKKYYQPESKLTGDTPPTLASFHVFHTVEGCRLWLHRMGYLESEYEIKEYSGDDIEEPTFVEVS